MIHNGTVGGAAGTGVEAEQSAAPKPKGRSKQASLLVEALFVKSVLVHAIVVVTLSVVAPPVQHRQIVACRWHIAVTVLHQCPALMHTVYWNGVNI
mgnify:CR=1 FL=1